MSWRTRQSATLRAMAPTHFRFPTSFPTSQPSKSFPASGQTGRLVGMNSPVVAQPVEPLQPRTVRLLRMDTTTVLPDLLPTLHLQADQ